jgi:hypothetical protein
MLIVTRVTSIVFEKVARNALGALRTNYSIHFVIVEAGAALLGTVAMRKHGKRQQNSQVHYPVFNLL